MRVVGPTAMAAAVLLVAGAARAGCCTVHKVDAELASVTLRVCEPSAAGPCGVWLFSGPLALGDAQRVCTAGDVLVYQEAAPEQPFGPWVEAVCNGGEVEV